MKKSAEKDTLIHTVARKVGRTVGTIAKATQELAANAAAIVQTDKAREKPTQTSRRRSTPKKKSNTAKSSTQRSRKRSSRRTSLHGEA